VNAYMMLFLFALGVFLTHVGTALTVEAEKHNPFNPSNWVCSMTITFFGLFLSVFSLDKLVRFANECLR